MSNKSSWSTCPKCNQIISPFDDGDALDDYWLDGTQFICPNCGLEGQSAFFSDGKWRLIENEEDN